MSALLQPQACLIVDESALWQHLFWQSHTSFSFCHLFPRRCRLHPSTMASLTSLRVAPAGKLQSGIGKGRVVPRSVPINQTASCGSSTDAVPSAAGGCSKVLLVASWVFLVSCSHNFAIVLIDCQGTCGGGCSGGGQSALPLEAVWANAVADGPTLSRQDMKQAFSLQVL
jgi:hypothetical protein